MFKTYLTIALRTLLRHKTYSLITILGLSVGVAACLLIFLVVEYELSYDTFHRNYDHIYRISTTEKYTNGTSGSNPGVPMPLVKALRMDMPKQLVLAALNVAYDSQITVVGDTPDYTVNNAKFTEPSGIFFAEPTLFDIFEATWLAGNPKTALAEPGLVVLSRTQAEKYFGDWKQAPGRYLKLDNLVMLKVSGIVADAPMNSDFPWQVLISYLTIQNYPKQYGDPNEWGNLSSNYQLFVRLPENLSAIQVGKWLNQIAPKYYNKKNSYEKTHFLVPLRDIHFDTVLGNLGDHAIGKSTLWTLSLIGVLIILMACINFVNLATAQSVGRSKEVGVRKVLGSNRGQLVGQFMGETMLIVLIALVLGVGLATLALPYLREVSDLPEAVPFLNNPLVWVFLGVLLMVISVLSGLYPAVVLSGFEPVQALKNRLTSRSVGGISLRRLLVVTQFAISQVLIISTVVAVSQMDYVRNIELGFTKEAIYLTPLSPDSLSIHKFAGFKAQLEQLPEVKSVSLSSDPPSSDNNWASNFGYNGGNDAEFPVFLKFADTDYFHTYNLQVLAGKVYTEADTAKGFVVNETLLKQLGVKSPQEALGKPLRLGSKSPKPIVGVVKDFKANSVREAIKPMLIGSQKEFYYTAAIKIHPIQLQKTTTAIQNLWEKTFPEYVYSGEFFDEKIARFYRQENKLARMYKVFAVLAIFISCLGLYGLVSFMAVQKTKEIGIRKVLGASIGHIIFLFSKEFTILIGLAFLIAIPIGWYMTQAWLQNFVYRIHLNVSVFLLSVLVSLGIAWLTVGYRALRAALVNPVESLRSE